MKLILTFPNGDTASIETGDWQSANPDLATLLNFHNRSVGPASYLPHPYLHVAELIVQQYDAKLTTEGDQADDDEPVNPEAIH